MGLRELREDRLWTQKDLADRAGVSNKTIVGLERGGVRPHRETIRKLAAALGVSPRDLVRELRDR